MVCQMSNEEADLMVTHFGDHLNVVLNVEFLVGLPVRPPKT